MADLHGTADDTVPSSRPSGYRVVARCEHASPHQGANHGFDAKHPLTEVPLFSKGRVGDGKVLVRKRDGEMM